MRPFSAVFLLICHCKRYIFSTADSIFSW